MTFNLISNQHLSMAEKINGIVLNIERYTLHDGPGIRTTVFLKGCPLRCIWCSNPESQNSLPEIIYFRERCSECRRCINVCPQNAIIQNTQDEPVTILYDLCNGCGLCAEVCFFEALTIAGKKMSAQEVFDIVSRDYLFYKHSNGGVTLSGGEPLSQPKFSTEILRLCKKQGIHTAIQTSGYAPHVNLQQLTSYLDLVIFDIKHLDKKIHKNLTGVSNDQILNNLFYLNSIQMNIVIQIALIPGYNDSIDNMKEIIKLVGSLPSIKGLSLLSYHTLGVTKYRCTGREYSLPDLKQPSAEYLEEKKQFFQRHGVHLVKFNG